LRSLGRFLVTKGRFLVLTLPYRSSCTPYCSYRMFEAKESS
jgi:hypothetical protein